MSIKPAYPQKKPDLTAEIVLFPITLVIFFKSIFGISVALSDRELRDNFTPGAIMPPKYIFLIITSNVVAVPKSKIIKLSLLLSKLIALVNLSDPT